MGRTSSVSLLAALVAVTVACGDDPAPAPGCVTGQTIACACVGGASGVQTCLADHGYGACACPGGDSGTDAPTADATDAPATDALATDALATHAPTDGGADATSIDVDAPIGVDATDAFIANDATDAFIAIDASVATDAPDALDIPDAIDASDASIAFDVSDASASLDVPDAPDVVSPVDIPDVPVPVDILDVSVPVDRPATLRCDGPRALRLPLDDVDGTLLSTGGTLGASERCAYDLTAAGEEHVYALTLATRTGVALSTDASGTDVDTVVSVRRVCDDASSEVACDDASGTVVGTSRLRTILEPGDYRVVVDRYATGSLAGTYHLSLRTFAAVPGAVCAEPNALAPNTDVTGDTSGAITRAPACSGTAPQLFYRLTIPPRTRVNLQLTASGAQGSSVTAFSDCAAATCLRSLSAGARGFLGNDTDVARTVLLAVSSQSATTAAAFTLRANLVPLSPNAICADAAALAPGASVTGNTDLAVNPSTGCVFASGPRLSYRVTVPPRSHVPVTLTPDGVNQLSLATRDTCADTFCREVQSVQGRSYTTELLNGTDAPRDQIVEVMGVADVPPGTFTLRAGAAAPLTTGTACELAETLAPGATLSGNVTGAIATWASCRVTNLRQRQRGYAVTVPPGQRVVVTVSPTSGMPYLSTADSCAADAQCRINESGSDFGPVVALANPGSTPRTFPIALGISADSLVSASIPYTITASAPVALAPGATCANAILVAPGSTVSGNTIGAEPSVCGGGPTRAYRVVIPPSSVGAITVTRTGSIDSIAYLTPGCPGLVCNSMIGQSTSGGPVVWRYGNPGPSARELIVLIAARSTSAAFDLNFATAAAPGYALTTAATPACEVLDAPVHVSLRGDNAVTRPIALPFPFRFYGAPQTHYTISTNGLLQFVAADGSGSTAFNASMLPSTAAPPNLVAAFWNNLESDARSFTHWQVFGAAPSRHLVVEWIDYDLGAFSRVTFQVRLDEATGQVQVSHCDLRSTQTSDELASSPITVGLQDATGTVGHLAVFSDPAALRALRRFTFDPR